MSSSFPGRVEKPIPAPIAALDGFLEICGRLFHLLANLCLALMLIGTAFTIVLRPINVSFYWLWPWTMVFFVWMSFFGFYAVYRRGKDISVDFIILRMGDRAMAATCCRCRPGRPAF